MLTLLALLTPIALVDSVMSIPVYLVPLILLTRTKHPAAGTLAFVAGVYLPYSAAGLAVLFGLDGIFDALDEEFYGALTNPDTIDLILQSVIGVLLITVGYRLQRSRQGKAAAKRRDALRPRSAFMLSAGLTIVGLPGALPYLAAIDQILKADPAALHMVFVVFFYNTVFVLPLVVLVLIPYLFPKHGMQLVDAVSAFFTTWGRAMIVVLLLLLGGVLVADAGGWFLGRPLIPV